MKAFVEAKALAVAEIPEVAALNITLPWIDVFQEQVQDFMGTDYWRYGINECRDEIETLIGYSWEQGLLARKLSIDDIFHPSTFAVSKT